MNRRRRRAQKVQPNPMKRRYDQENNDCGTHDAVGQKTLVDLPSPGEQHDCANYTKTNHRSEVTALSSEAQHLIEGRRVAWGGQFEYGNVTIQATPVPNRFGQPTEGVKRQHNP